MIKNKNYMLAAGQLSLAISFGIKQFLPFTRTTDFFSGFTLGLSLVFNVAYLIQMKKAGITKG
jgi:hypothetical protein